MSTPAIKSLILATFLLGCLALTPRAAEVNIAPTEPKPYPERAQWWGDGRFGMFIHWGPVSLKGTEISWSRANSNPKCPNNGPIPAAEYDSLYQRFNPTKFSAKEWVAIARAAGMRYMVLTAKHCDGFLLWDSKVDAHNIMHTPFKRDVCAELAKAAHEAGMRIGWYFSPMDWRDPDCRNEKNAEFVQRMQEELRELLTNYGRIDLLWFDADGRSVPWEQERTYALVKKLQPQIVINNRLDLSDQDAGNPKNIGPHADYCTPEQWIGGYDTQHPWESCMTLSARNQWAWGGAEDGVKPYQACLEMLVRCAGGDGNVLLNVGPMPTGEIAPEQVERLRQIGAWLAQYGESIYGTRGGPFKPGDYGASTRKGNIVYLHIRDWDDGRLILPAIPAKIMRSRALGGGNADVRQTAAGIEVSVPERNRQPLDTIVALELDSAAEQIPAIAVPGMVSLCTQAKATASNVYQHDASYGPDKAVDGHDDTRWATDSETKSAWLEVDLGKPAEFSRAVIRQAFPELKRIRKYAIEYWQEGQWKSCYEGTNPGEKVVARFTPVTSQRVRLNITEATDGPTIWEFALFPPHNPSATKP
jgi:alpha-L-fucosidase